MKSGKKQENDNMSILDLVEGAKSGDKQSLEELALQVQPRIRAFVFRSTLNNDVADDLTQDVSLKMITSISTLRNNSSFWPWLYRIAANNINSYFRQRKASSAVNFSSLEEHMLQAAIEDDTFEVENRPVYQELSNIVIKAVEKLKIPQRMVFSMRCFEKMTYPQIAKAIGCTENSARVNFFRAKKQLQSKLKKRGIKPASMLLAIVLFGKITAGQKALAATITQSSVASGLSTTTVAAVAGALTSKFTKIISAAVITISVVCLYIYLNKPSLPDRAMVRSIYFTEQGVGSAKGSSSLAGQDIENTGIWRTKGAYEQWCSFPDGPDGSMMFKMQRWNIDRTQQWCSWLQDGIANYYYDSGAKKLYITNDPVGNLILPTDSQEFIEFIAQQIKSLRGIDFKYDKRTGLVKKTVDNRVDDIKDFTSKFSYNSFQKDIMQPFWEEIRETIDQRDQMHKRGWTYFTVEGQISQYQVTGKGRMPFVYATCKEHTPWLHIKIGDFLEVIENDSGAFLIDHYSSKQYFYPTGTFFKGLGRPWLGLCSYDVVRRDAASHRIPFNSERKDETGRVTVKKQQGYSSLRVEYVIDMAKDVINDIEFQKIDDRIFNGRISFKYFQQLDDSIEDFKMPVIAKQLKDSSIELMDSPGFIWLVTNKAALVADMN